VHARERIIRSRFTEHECGRCHAHFTEDSVTVLARRRSTWMVMACCPRCQRRALYVVSFPDAQSLDQQVRIAAPDIFPNSFLSSAPGSDPLQDDLLAPSDHSAAKLPPLPITSADVNAMHDFLQRFDGDFRTLFARKPPRP